MMNFTVRLMNLIKESGEDALKVFFFFFKCEEGIFFKNKRL